jgi:hypothetical protein
VTRNGVTAGTYQCDGRGLRTVKIVNGENILFIYCKSGRLIAEADSDGNILKEYISTWKATSLLIFSTRCQLLKRKLLRPLKSIESDSIDFNEAGTATVL